MPRRVLLSVPAVALIVVGVLATGAEPTAFGVLYLAAVTSWLVWFDVREHRLPNVLVLPGVAVAAAGVAAQWLATGRMPEVPLIAAAAYSGFLLLLHVIGGMGMGDVKLAAVLGLASWTVSVAVLAVVIAFTIGGVVATVLLIAGRRGRRIAFGPYLLGGFWAAVATIATARLMV